MFLQAARIFSVILACVAISKSYVDFRGRRESLQIFIFWIIAWTGVVVVALFPPIVDLLIHRFGEGRTGLGTFFGMALVLLFFMVYRIYVKVDRIQQTLTKAIQDMALREDWKSSTPEGGSTSTPKSTVTNRH
jgi:small membrane protein